MKATHVIIGLGVLTILTAMPAIALTHQTKSVPKVSTEQSTPVIDTVSADTAQAAPVVEPSVTTDPVPTASAPTPTPAPAPAPTPAPVIPHADWMSVAGIAVADQATAYKVIDLKSGWDYSLTAADGGYGLCDAFPASRMEYSGAGYRTNPVDQLRYCNDYVRNHYGSWANALTAGF